MSKWLELELQDRQHMSIVRGQLVPLHEKVFATSDVARVMKSCVFVVSPTRIYHVAFDNHSQGFVSTTHNGFSYVGKSLPPILRCLFEMSSFDNNPIVNAARLKTIDKLAKLCYNYEHKKHYNRSINITYGKPRRDVFRVSYLGTPTREDF